MVLIEPILRCSALKTPSWTWALGFCGSVGGACRFPPKEFELLSVLLGHAGQVVHRERLLAAGWDNPREVGKALEVYIRRLRQKIEADPHHPTHIRTVRGIGYIFDREALGWAS